MAEKFAYSDEFKREALALHPNKPSLKCLLDVDSIVAGFHMRPDTTTDLDPQHILDGILMGGEAEDQVVAQLSNLARQRALFKQWQDMARAALPTLVQADSKLFE